MEFGRFSARRSGAARIRGDKSARAVHPSSRCTPRISPVRAQIVPRETKPRSNVNCLYVGIAAWPALRWYSHAPAAMATASAAAKAQGKGCSHFFVVEVSLGSFSELEVSAIGFFSDPPQLQSYVACRLETVVWIFLQARADHAFERCWRQGLQLADRRWVFFQDCAGNADLALALKGPLARRHFVKDRAECEHIRARVSFFAFNLFRRHAY